VSDAGLDIIIKARNDAEKALKQVSGQLDDVEKKGHSAAGGIDKLAGVLKGALVAAIGVVSIKALADGLGSMVSAAMEAEDIQADLNATLASTKGVSGMTTESINELALSLSKVTRFEDDSIVKAQAMILTFTNIGKNIFPETTEATLNMAQKFGMDASQAAITLGKALNDPITGVGSLRRIGVQLTEQQEEQIKSMLDAEKGMWAFANETERATLMEKAQKIILGELNTEIGGVARAAGETAAGKLDIMKNKLGNIQEEIGAKFLPVLVKLADGLSAALDDPKVQKALDTLFALIDRVITALMTGQAPVVQFSGVMVDLQAVVTELGGKVIGFVQEQLVKITRWVEDNRPLIEKFGQTVGVWANNMLQAISRLWDFVGPVLNSMINLILGMARAVMQIATGDWQGAWDTITGVVSEHMQVMWDTVTSAIGAVLGWIGDRVGDFQRVGGDMLGGLISGINGAIDALIQAAANGIWAVIEAIKGLLGLGGGGSSMMVAGGGGGGSPYLGGAYPAPAYSTATSYSHSAAYNVQVNDGLSGALLLDQVRREQERRITRYM
jgi:phage-related protein